MRGAQRRSRGRCRGGGDLALEAATEAGPARGTTKERGRYGSVTRYPWVLAPPGFGLLVRHRRRAMRLRAVSRLKWLTEPIAGWAGLGR